MEESDRELIAAVLAGDRDRFGVLVDRHGPALLAFLARRTRGREEARELFQETLVRAFEGLGDLRAGERLRSWLISIAHNTLRQRLRRPRDEPFPLDLPAPAEDRERLEREESAARARAAVAALPPRQREVFELRVVGELEHARIGELLGITEENSRANFHQAMRSLRARLGDENP